MAPINAGVTKRGFLKWMGGTLGLGVVGCGAQKRLAQINERERIRRERIRSERISEIIRSNHFSLYLNVRLYIARWEKLTPGMRFLRENAILVRRGDASLFPSRLIDTRRGRSLFVNVTELRLIMDKVDYKLHADKAVIKQIKEAVERARQKSYYAISAKIKIVASPRGLFIEEVFDLRGNAITEGTLRPVF